MNKIKKIILLCLCVVLAICQINIRSYAVSVIKEGTYSKPHYKEFSKNKANWGPKAEVIYNKMVAAGASPSGACAMLGNITAESRLNPKAKNTEVGIHYGLVQWGGGRLTNLKKLSNYDTIEVQADFMINELKTRYKGTWDQIIKCTENELVDTTDYIRRNYEVVGATSKFYRIEFAVDWYNYFGSPVTINNIDNLPDVKEELEFTYGVPSEYDVEVDSKDFGKTIVLPAIRVSVEDVLYSEDPLLGINFLGNDTTLKQDPTVDDTQIQVSDFQKRWNTYRDIVKSFLKVFLYFSAAILITLLLYISLIVVKNGIFSGNDLPTSEKNTKPAKGRLRRVFSDTLNPNSAKKEKVFLQEWIKATFLIAFIVLIINLISGFGNLVTSSIKDLKTEEKKILIYVKGDGNQVQDFYFKTKLEGYCRFMSHFDWKKFGIKNWGYMMSGALIAIVKITLYIIFIVRMYVAGIFIIVSPIIILINSFKKISGEENPTTLKNWIKWFVFLTILRPAISIVYYIIFGLNPYSFAKDPIYIVLLFVFFILVIVFLFYLAIRINVKTIRKKK